MLALRDQDGRDWCSTNQPYEGLATRTAVPEQSWLLPDGTEVLVVARLHHPALDRPVEQVAVSIRSGRGRARAPTGSAPTWWRRSRTSYH